MGFLPDITLSNIATIAMISKMWMIPPALYTKKPSAQRMIKTTAIKYNRLPMMLKFNG